MPRASLCREHKTLQEVGLLPSARTMSSNRLRTPLLSRGRRSADCMGLLNASHLPPGVVIGGPLARFAGLGGRLFPTHSERHVTQDLGSARPRAMRPARANMQASCTNPPWGHRTGTGMRLSPDPPAESSRTRPQYVHDASACSLRPSLLHVGRFHLRSRPPLPPKSLTTTKPMTY